MAAITDAAADNKALLRYFLNPCKTAAVGKFNLSAAAVLYYSVTDRRSIL